MFYSRPDPWDKFANNSDAPLTDVIVRMGEMIKKGEVSDKEVVQFLQQHRILFHNSRTNMLSSDWSEPEASYAQARFYTGVSCSCGCGPLAEPCNEEGPGSKPNGFGQKFTFEK